MNKMNYGCEGLCVAISGGTSGIGLAAAQRFLADGARVYILGRSEERGAQALCYLDEQTGKQAVYISCDVTKQAECKAAVAKIAEQEGRPDWQLDILVNSAGFYREQRLEQLTEADFDAMMNVNVKGMMFLTQAALPYLRSKSSVVNIASDAAVSGRRERDAGRAGAAGCVHRIGSGSGNGERSEHTNCENEGNNLLGVFHS